jgi:hypothetical protein
MWPNPRPFRSLPLSVYWFDDGMYVIAAPERYRSLLGGRIVAIGKSGIDDAIAKLTPLTPHDNDSWLKQVIAANKLTDADCLYGTRIADSTAAVDVQTQTASGELRTVTVESVDQAQSASMIPVFQGELPLYRRHPERRYWATPSMTALRCISSTTDARRIRGSPRRSSSPSSIACWLNPRWTA